MFRRGIFYFVFLLLPIFSFGQKPTQSIRGTVIDKESESPLPGVTVIVLNSDSLIGTTTDVNGKYTLHHVPIGRINLQFTFMGYKPLVLNNIVLDAGKEGIANAKLEQSVDTLNEVVIHAASRDKNVPLNEMSTLSTRQFAPDDASRYAGSLGDPSRMASNFAGVGVADDTRNDVVIRGNSPLGLLWKMDGVDIPNPNHFGTLGSTGGPVSILNNNVLDNSDFMTGAFPAEYGNALAGVFDLKMRTGNTDKSEFAGQVGFNGFELQAEGPFSKNSSASYIVDVRYSTLVLFNLLGINFGYAAVPQYSDITFKFNFPTAKCGTFSIFGLGGPSYIDILAKDLSKDNYSLSPFNEDTYFASNMGAVGASNKYFFNEKTSQTISVSASGIQNIVKIDTNSGGDQKVTYGQRSTDMTYSLSYTLNSKVNKKNTLRFGANLELYSSNDADSGLIGNGTYEYLTKFNGTSPLLQSYGEWQHKFSDFVVMNAGLHYQEFMLNNSTAIEPRLGFKWRLTEKQSVGIAGGMHSQLLPMYLYYFQTELSNGTYATTNKDLGFSRSDHIVVSYDNNFAPSWRIKLESYYQYLYDIPVQRYASTYSTLNLGASYYDNPVDSLVNKGTGRNYGAELTIEKFFNKDYYLLVTGSLYEAKYTASDGVERNTAFNGNYTLNVLGGADIYLDKNKKHVITVSVKGNYAGGKRYIPVDLAASQLAHTGILDYSEAYAHQYPDYSRVDVKIGFKLNGKKITQEWAFEAQNVLGKKNIFQQIYNPETNKIETDYQLGFFPLGSYRITF